MDKFGVCKFAYYSCSSETSSSLIGLLVVFVAFVVLVVFISLQKFSLSPHTFSKLPAPQHSHPLAGNYLESP